MYFLCNLCRPAELHMGEQFSDEQTGQLAKQSLLPTWEQTAEWLASNLKPGGRRAVHSDPSWSEMPDLLVDPQTSEFLGVTFYFEEKWTHTVADALREADPKMVRYGELLPDDRRKYYEFVKPVTRVLEVVWAERPTMETWPGNLQGMDCWFQAPTKEDGNAIVGLGIFAVEFVLVEHCVRMPDSYCSNI